MKHLFLFGVMLISFGACKFSATKPPVNNTIDTYSQYSLISYVNNGVEYKSKYSGLSFQFGASGQLVVNNAGIISQGNWSAPVQDSLIIKNFTSTPLDVLNANWHMTGIENDVIFASFTNGVDVKKAQWKKQ